MIKLKIEFKLSCVTIVGLNRSLLVLGAPNPTESKTMEDHDLKGDHELNSSRVSAVETRKKPLKKLLNRSAIDFLQQITYGQSKKTAAHLVVETGVRTKIFGCDSIATNPEGNLFSTISRDHFTVTNDGEYVYVQDLNSTNGTYVNGREIIQNKLARLENGDLIGVGGYDHVGDDYNTELYYLYVDGGDAGHFFAIPGVIGASVGEIDLEIRRSITLEDMKGYIDTF